MQCYEQALKFNQWSVPAMQGIACILRTKDAFPAAVEYLRTILKVDPANGDVWGSLGKHSSLSSSILQLIAIGHCYLMMDDLQQAYSAYQQALYHLSDPKVCPRSSVNIDFQPLIMYRNPNSGTASESSTIAMVLSSMPKRLSRKLCAWNLASRRQMRSISDLG